MAIIPTEKKIESSHWYTSGGDSCHRVKLQQGGYRNTNLKDARKLGLYPSVTGILSVFAKPQLDTWKQKQVVASALRNQKPEKESEESYTNRVINDAFKQVDDAADFGTRVHDAIETWIKTGKPWEDQYDIYLRPVANWFREANIEIVASELRVVNKRFGYAGTMDLAFQYGTNGIGVLDFKTRKTKEGESVKSYPFQDMQIAAYGATYWSQQLGITEEEAMDRMIGCNLYISSTEAGRIDHVKYSSSQLSKCFPVFTKACSIWRYLKNYDPRGHSEVVGKVVEDDLDKMMEDVEAKRAKKESEPTPPLSTNGIIDKYLDKAKKREDEKKGLKSPEGESTSEVPEAKEDTENPKEEPVWGRNSLEQIDQFLARFVFVSGKYKGKPLNAVPTDYLEKIKTGKVYQKLRDENPLLVPAIHSTLKSK